MKHRISGKALTHFPLIPQNSSARSVSRLRDGDTSTWPGTLIVQGVSPGIPYGRKSSEYPRCWVLLQPPAAAYLRPATSTATQVPDLRIPCLLTLPNWKCQPDAISSTILVSKRYWKLDGCGSHETKSRSK
ncbi:hypothetical protein LB506_000499 [Fusarium annulatum]|nr:hypothetical protein LB506_000499 [Fusarium annulatum]